MRRAGSPTYSTTGETRELNKRIQAVNKRIKWNILLTPGWGQGPTYPPPPVEPTSHNILLTAEEVSRS